MIKTHNCSIAINDLSKGNYNSDYKQSIYSQRKNQAHWAFFKPKWSQNFGRYEMGLFFHFKNVLFLSRHSQFDNILGRNLERVLLDLSKKSSLFKYKDNFI